MNNLFDNLANQDSSINDNFGLLNNDDLSSTMEKGGGGRRKEKNNLIQPQIFMEFGGFGVSL